MVAASSFFFLLTEAFLVPVCKASGVWGGFNGAAVPQCLQFPLALRAVSK